MKIYCKKTKRTFEKYKEEKTGWSSDNLPVCPYCFDCPWHPDFWKNHKKIK